MSLTPNPASPGDSANSKGLPPLPRAVQGNPYKCVAFIGLGMIAGSLAKLIRQRLPETRILAMDTLEVVEMALQQKVVDQALETLSDTTLDGVDLVILGTHLHQSYDVLKALGTHVTRPLVVMDLGSAKAPILDVASELPSNITFFGGHPLAGREVSGYINSQWDLFLGKKFLLTPNNHTHDTYQHNEDAESMELKYLLDWLNRLGTSPLVLNAMAHDRLMALVSHFPQTYALILGGLLYNNHPHTALSFLGGGLDDQMRLMNSPYAMWKDVLKDNKDGVLPILDQFIALCQQMRNDIAADNVEPWFEQSQHVYHTYQAIKSGQWHPPTINSVSETFSTNPTPTNVIPFSPAPKPREH